MVANPTINEEPIAIFAVPRRAIIRLTLNIGLFLAMVPLLSRLLMLFFDRDASHHALSYVAPWASGSLVTGFFFAFLVWSGKATIVLTRESVSWHQRSVMRLSSELPLKGLVVKPVRRRIGVSHYLLTNPNQKGKMIIVEADLENLDEFQATLSRLTGQIVPPLR